MWPVLYLISYFKVCIWSINIYEYIKNILTVWRCNATAYTCKFVRFSKIDIIIKSYLKDPEDLILTILISYSFFSACFIIVAHSTGSIHSLLTEKLYWFCVRDKFSNPLIHKHEIHIINQIAYDRVNQFIVHFDKKPKWLSRLIKINKLFKIYCLINAEESNKCFIIALSKYR